MKKKAIIFALFSAILYALNTPFSKIMMGRVDSTMLGGIMYFGAGIGAICSFILVFRNKPEENKRINKKDAFKLGLVVALDIFAICLIMLGIKHSNASTASLLCNFEIVATSFIAHFFFEEKVRSKLWIAILIITSASFILSINTADGFTFSIGSVYILIGTIAWGIENNVTHQISHNSTSKIVIAKGLGTGIGSIIIAFILKEHIPSLIDILLMMLVGFLVYGISTFFFIRAQHDLGAPRASAFYASSPFIATILSFVFLQEKITLYFVVGFLLMLAGTTLTIVETLEVATSTDKELNMK